jgi:predicted ATPase/DNA-binding CsgD family transcriptional regulator
MLGAHMKTSTRFALPRPLTPLVGRDRELAELTALLTGHRLVTLTGPGGCGKTRLAVAVAAEVAGAFADGVRWVELTGVAEPEGVARAIESALAGRERPADRDLLLVLDNCEHLVEACAAAVSALLAACPGVRILVTSREPLRINGERDRSVPPLPVPDPGNLPPVRSLPRYDAVRLLVERISAVEPGFAVNADNARAVALVCQQLDGLPLAIELTAARARMLAIEEIAARLTTPVLFRRLAVFRSGFTAAAAEAVCGGAEIEPAQVFDLLTRLVEKSLVLVVKHRGAARYHLLETIRQYAWEKSHDAGEAAESQRRHARYFLELAEDIAPRLNTADRDRWLARLKSEVDNLRAALAWSRGGGPPGVAVRLAAALMWFWLYGGYFSEARGWLAGAANRAAGQPDRRTATAIAQAHAGAGFLALAQGDHAGARAHLERSVALWRKLPQAQGLGQALRWLSATVEAQGRALIEESVRSLGGAPNGFELARSLAKLGHLAEVQDDLGAAWPAFEESVAISRRIGDRWSLAMALRLLGIAESHRGRYQRAADRLTEALALLRDADHTFLTVHCLEALAAVLAERDEPVRAARLFGAMEALRERVGLAVMYPQDHERGVATARVALGDKAFHAGWAAGRTMSLVAATKLALEAAAPTAAPAELTARETDVLRLVARGMTNEQVARELFISPRTVNWHLTSVYGKLGLRSRTEATRFALEHGLR